MLKAVPRSIFSWDFDIFDGPDPVGVIDMSWFIEGGKFYLNGHEYRLIKAGIFSREFSLEENGRIIAEAHKRAIVRSFVVSFGGDHYTLRAEHPVTRRFVVERDGARIGGIVPDHIFTRRCSVDLPNSVPMEVQFFMLWLTLLMWRRAARSTSGGAGGS